MIRLEVGTLVEVLRTKIVSEVCVVDCSDPLILRSATYFERWRFWWKMRRVSAHEIAAAAESNSVIERARTKETP